MTGVNESNENGYGSDWPIMHFTTTFSNMNATEGSENANSTGEGVRTLSYVERTVVVILYTLVSIAAVAGNLCVVFIVVYFRRMRTPTNVLILNLAVADLLMAVLCIPFSYWPLLILRRWPFGWLLCKIIHFSQAAVVMSSAYTLIAISLDRFVAIMCPMKPALKLTKKRALYICAIVWLVAVLIAFPLLIVMETQVIENELHCAEKWSFGGNATEVDVEAAYAYSVATMFLQYFFPLLVLIVTYSGIGLRLWYSSVPGETGREVMKGRQDSVKKMIPTMFVVTSVYAFCWLPLNVFNVLLGLYPSISDHKYVLYIWGACHFTAMFNSMANPIIYCSRNKKFRDAFIFIFRWLPGVHYESYNSCLTGNTTTACYSPVYTSGKTSTVSYSARPSVVRVRSDGACVTVLENPNNTTSDAQAQNNCCYQL